MLQSKSLLFAGIGAVAGSLVTFAGMSRASAPSVVPDPQRAYVVSLDEVRQNFVFGQEFTGTYTRTVTLSDGSVREITLRPVIKDGLRLVELTDKSATGTGRTFMGPNGATTNGTLMVSIADLHDAKASVGIRE